MPEAAAATAPDAATAERALARLLEAELATPVPDAVAAMADAIRARHGDAARAVLFYGSCLRRGVVEGVLDYYLLVDDYAAAYGSRFLALLNRALPPNVFYVEIEHAGGRLRAKYAVFSQRDFAARAGGGPDARVWARFCQPARLVWSRDDASRADAVAAVLRATQTAAAQMLAWLPGEAREQRVEPASLWTRGFRATYGSELRGEAGDTIDALYASQPQRYARVAALALASDARFDVRADGDALCVASDPAWRAAARRAWSLRRRAAKALTFLGLLKTTLTFDDWVSYALWKLERHSGRPVEVTERQRRHPFVYGWPVLYRLLRERTLR
ncbi:MAG: hypothetical protein DCC71_02180 [Proteobacteria bacterium]|nr:MAG: hypothetical protein DCC71_02180 [Pseudomonadota bacterium]